MAMLVPCESCNRHVRCGEACPFCGAHVADAAPSGIARSSRAALFALATAACGPTQYPPYGQPPPPPTETAEASAPPPATATTTNASAYGGPPVTTVTPKIAP